MKCDCFQLASYRTVRKAGGTWSRERVARDNPKPLSVWSPEPGGECCSSHRTEDRGFRGSRRSRIDTGNKLHDLLHREPDGCKASGWETLVGKR